LDAYRPLLKEAGAEALVRHQGWLMLYRSDASYRTAQSDFAIRRRRGVRFEELDEGTIRQLVPALRPGPVRGVMLPDCEHTVDPQRLTEALADDVRRRGGDFLVSDVRRIEKRSQGVVLHLDGAPRAFDCAIVAAGAWSKHLVRSLDDDTPLDTERGYHVMLEDTVGLRLPLVAADRKFSITPMSGGIRLGGTVEFGGLHAPPNPARWESMIRHARNLLPNLPPRPISTWMGFRPSMPDSLPVIGRSPVHNDVYYAFGHGHLGLTLAAVTGHAIADLVAQRRPSVDLEPYRPERF
jgi:D-amino-acid dehydrogenase